MASATALVASLQCVAKASVFCYPFGMKETESFNPEEENLERAISKLSDLSRELGFVSNQEIEDLLDLAAENTEELISKWRPLAEAVVERVRGDAWHKAQIGLLVEEARLILQTGKVDEFISSIDDAIFYADQIGLEEIVQDLDTLASPFRK
jgi:hypothetical protein